MDIDQSVFVGWNQQEWKLVLSVLRNINFNDTMMILDNVFCSACSNDIYTL